MRHEGKRRRLTSAPQKEKDKKRKKTAHHRTFYQGHFWNLLSNRLLLRVGITMNQLGVNTACPQDIATAKPRRTERSAPPPSGPVSIPNITAAPALCLLQEKPSCSLSNGALLRSGLEVLF